MAELEARVASTYARLDLPEWPDPHPDRAEPSDEEYSRLTEPQRYRIVHARARVWQSVLIEALGAQSEVLDPTGFATFDRGVRLVADVSAALPLLLLEHDVPQPEGRSLPSLGIAVVRPDLVVELQPDCGCDACDFGSEDLLGAVDAAIRRVVGGPFVLLRNDAWSAQWYVEGFEHGGNVRGRAVPDFHVVKDLCRRLAEGEPVELPADTEAHVGRSWIG